MSSLDAGIATIRTALGRIADAWRWYDEIPPVRRIHAALGQIPEAWRRMSRWLNSVMPKGLYARSLLIIIAPMVILQSVVAFVFMERHWNVVTQRLSASVVQDIGALIDVYSGYPQDTDLTQIRRIAQERLGLVVDFLPLSEMPPPGPSRSFRSWTRHCRRNCARRSAGRSGSTRSENRRWSKSACSSTRP